MSTSLPLCDRYWLLTSTTYGTWLPGDDRGFVSPVELGFGPEKRQNVPGTPYDAGVPGYRRVARASLKCPPIFFSGVQSQAVLQQFRETSRFRDWVLCAAAVMASHFHLVVGVPGDPDPDSMLRDVKAYASRALNEKWKKPASRTWWTESGSKRKLPDHPAVVAGVRYIANQEKPLALWIEPAFEELLGERGASAP